MDMIFQGCSAGGQVKAATRAEYMTAPDQVRQTNNSLANRGASIHGIGSLSATSLSQPDYPRRSPDGYAKAVSGNGHDR